MHMKCTVFSCTKILLIKNKLMYGITFVLSTPKLKPNPAWMLQWKACDCTCTLGFGLGPYTMTLDWGLGLE